MKKTYYVCEECQKAYPSEKEYKACRKAHEKMTQDLELHKEWYKHTYEDNHGPEIITFVRPIGFDFFRDELVYTELSVNKRSISTIHVRYRKDQQVMSVLGQAVGSLSKADEQEVYGILNTIKRDAQMIVTMVEECEREMVKDAE